MILLMLSEYFIYLWLLVLLYAGIVLQYGPFVFYMYFPLLGFLYIYVLCGSFSYNLFFFLFFFLFILLFILVLVYLIFLLILNLLSLPNFKWRDLYLINLKC
ncbi:hypothetical protein C2G38_2124569 [Gigaspora rosea]|uniref:Uncharacterized protein n=1 Tax=Gigaspora rosea TaxID=44941 RepID=A0A397TXT6_9GLOM|nr:hypothetical protein C2G38_2124569 [Gigaspora rosea]